MAESKIRGNAEVGQGSCFDCDLSDCYSSYFPPYMAEGQGSCFDFLGVHASVSGPLYRSRFKTPWPIQTLTIPTIINERADAVVRALPGSGKTFTYLVRILESLFFNISCATPRAIIVLPTFELCKKVHKQLMELVELRLRKVKVSLVGPESENLIENSEIVISTPAAVLSCLEHGLLRMKSLRENGGSISLGFFVLDEVDLLFLPGFEDGLTSAKSIIDCIPQSCQCLVFSANPSADVKKLKGLVLHNPYVFTLTEDTYCKAEISPYDFRHFYLPCKEDEKSVYLRYFLACKSSSTRVVIFTNSDEKSSWLNSLFQKCDDKSGELLAEPKSNYDKYMYRHKFGVLLAEPNNDSKYEVFKDFNEFNILIVTDTNQPMPTQSIEMKRKSTSLNSDSRCFVFKNVICVVHYDMPRDGDVYIRRILSTNRREDRIGDSISMATSLDKDVFKEIKSSLGEDGNLKTKFVKEIPWFGRSLGDVDDEWPLFSVEEVLEL